MMSEEGYGSPSGPNPSLLLLRSRVGVSPGRSARGLKRREGAGRQAGSLSLSHSISASLTVQKGPSLLSWCAASAALAEERV